MGGFLSKANGSGSKKTSASKEPSEVDKAMQHLFRKGERGSMTKDGLLYSEGKPMDNYASLPNLMSIQQPMHSQKRAPVDNPLLVKKRMAKGMDSYMASLMGVR